MLRGEERSARNETSLSANFFSPQIPRDMTCDLARATKVRSLSHDTALQRKQACPKRGGKAPYTSCQYGSAPSLKGEV